MGCVVGGIAYFRWFCGRGGVARFICSLGGRYFFEIDCGFLFFPEGYCLGLFLYALRGCGLGLGVYVCGCVCFFADFLGPFFMMGVLWSLERCVDGVGVELHCSFP